MGLLYFGDEFFDFRRCRDAELGGRSAERAHHASELLAGCFAFFRFNDNHVGAALDVYLSAESLQPFGWNQKSVFGIACVARIGVPRAVDEQQYSFTSTEIPP